jgi:serine/threonine-protein phosphatase 2A regulatory subunit A
MDGAGNEDDIAIYIDELKCDDPNLKLNAVSKIVDIARILGPNRTREELVPYLTEIIEECDNDDDFLVKLAENLVLLKGR